VARYSIATAPGDNKENKVQTAWCGPEPAAVLALLVLALSGALPATAASAAEAASALARARESAPDLSRLSLEELGDIEISSVSKRREPLSAAAAAAYVITREDIRRAGITSLPEALRLAPNLQVARVDSKQYAITARGFNSTTANKLLVLIDGRSVYTPLYSGVFWDVQDVMLEDIEQIEVISGPGGTLWGSNAVNGVINIVTRSARNTQGNIAVAGAGNEERSAAARHGGALGDDAGYRIYAKGFRRSDTTLANGSSAEDAWNLMQTGFRMDWERAGEALALHGDAYRGTLEQRVFDDEKVSGTNLVARWSRTLAADSAVQVQAYFDRTRRARPGTFGEVLDTYDAEVQHRFGWGTSHAIVWGAGYRQMLDNVQNSAVLAFLPAQKRLRLSNVFAQDSVALSERWELTVGAKLERNSYTGAEFQPNVRLALKLPDQGLLWSAISRAVRTPSRVDRALFAPPAPPFLLAGGQFESEKLTAFELGYRLQRSPVLTFSVSIFYNVYSDLRSVEPVGGTLVLANQLEGKTYGLEAWGSYRLSETWRLSAGYSTLHKDLKLKPGSADLTSLAGADTDPSYQWFARSSMNLGRNAELDVRLRIIDGLRGVPGYAALDVRLGWIVGKDVLVALTGNNLLDRRHPEFLATALPAEIQRSVFLSVLVSF